MMIRYLEICDFGAVHSYRSVLNPNLNLLDYRIGPELASAIEYLLCRKNRCAVPTWWIRKNTCIIAGVLLNETEYTVKAKPVKGELQLFVTDPEGSDATEAYRQLLHHCPEQDGAEYFDGRDKTLPMRLCRYRNWEDYGTPADLSHGTDYLAATKIFRSQLNRYIQTFQPERIHCRKSYQVTINRQGKFEVYHPGVNGDVFLSETEEKLFHYICFLNIAEFWTQIESTRDLHHERKPLLIRNFLEFLDESTELDGLLERTLHLQRQVILLAPSIKESFIPGS